MTLAQFQLYEFALGMDAKIPGLCPGILRLAMPCKQSPYLIELQLYQGRFRKNSHCSDDGPRRADKGRSSLAAFLEAQRYEGSCEMATGAGGNRDGQRSTEGGRRRCPGVRLRLA